MTDTAPTAAPPLLLEKLAGFPEGASIERLEQLLLNPPHRDILAYVSALV